MVAFALDPFVRAVESSPKLVLASSTLRALSSDSDLMPARQLLLAACPSVCDESRCCVAIPY